MADSTTNLAQLKDGQPLNRRTVNEINDALSPASYWGRNADACVDLTWGFYGGVIAGTRHPNGTLALTANSTCYIEHTLAGVASFNTSAFTASRVHDYIATTDANGVTSYLDVREGGGGGGSIPVVGSYNTGTQILLLTASDGKQYELGPFA